jgi:hypothetical protein
MKLLGIILVSSIFVVSCNDGISTPTPPANSLIGSWRWSGKVFIPDLSTTDSFDLQIDITVGADSTASYAQYFASKYAKGFTGHWKFLANDTVGIIPSECFKGDSNGISKPNSCTEDFPDSDYRFYWNNTSLSLANATQPVVFVKFH